MIERAQFVEVLGVAAQQGPADARRGCGVRHLRKYRGTGRFEQDGVGARNSRRLDSVEELLALQDAVIPGRENLQFHVGFAGYLARSFHLLDLEIVIFVGHRKQEARLGHGDVAACSE